MRLDSLNSFVINCLTAKQRDYDIADEGHQLQQNIEGETLKKDQTAIK